MKGVYKIFIACLLFLSFATTNLTGQGWVYNNVIGLNTNLATDVAVSDDGGYLAVGISTDFGPVSGSQILVIKLNAEGEQQWLNTFSAPNSFSSGANAVDNTPDGGYIIGGYATFNNQTTDRNPYLIRINAQGDTLWTRTVSNTGTDEITDIKTTADGGFAAALNWAVDIPGGGTTNASSILKLDANGNTQWQQTYFFDDFTNYVYGMDLTNDNGYILAGRRQGQSYLIRTNSAGDTLWTQLVIGGEGDRLTDVKQMADGGFVVCGEIGGFAGTNPIVARISPTGELESFDFAGVGNTFGIANGVELTSDGGYVVGVCGIDPATQEGGFIHKYNAAGNSEWITSFYDQNANPCLVALKPVSDGFVVAGQHNNGTYVAKTDVLGNTYSVLIQGNVYHDPDLNCDTDDAPFSGLENWIIEAEGTSGTFYGLSDENGDYSINADTGDYVITAYPPSDAWSTCGPPVSIEAPDFYDTLDVDFFVGANYYCPSLSVDISAPFLRRCFDNTYNVVACNNGTLLADPATVDITLDPFMTYINSSIPPTGQNGNVLNFDLGQLDPGDCTTFDVTVDLSCNAVLGQTHCTEAHIMPDTLCNVDPAWDESSIMVDAQCEGDSIRFFIRNIGDGDMTGSSNYLVIEDQIILMNETFMLTSMEEITVVVPANGSTWRLEAEQSPFHPGFSMPSVTVEGCIATPAGPFTLGIVTQYPEDDANSFVSIDCQPNIGAFDPNDKQGFPVGYGPEHYITDDTEIEYLIRFQNTGTDTAFTVVIRDDISEYLDIATFRPGASSHPYELDFTSRTAKFTFNNIMLPDSNINEPASHGFVKFRIAQIEGNPIGTLIENSADIYFDFNAPITTNTTFHEVGEDYIDEVVVSIEEVFEEGLQVSAAPNPFSDFTRITLDGNTYDELQLQLFDSQGRMVRQLISRQTNELFLERGQLTPGVYFFRLLTENEKLAVGKLVVF